jgi:hypothetical protein
VLLKNSITTVTTALDIIDPMVAYESELLDWLSVCATRPDVNDPYLALDIIESTEEFIFLSSIRDSLLFELESLIAQNEMAFQLEAAQLSLKRLAPTCH